MATPAQINANRRNAQLSTGPRTDEGKQVASRNATKLGLFSKHLLLPDEDPAELEALRADLLERLQPADALEHLYADRILCTAWRLRRALAGEATVFSQWQSWEKYSPQQVHARQMPLDNLDRLQRHIASLERAMDKAMTELARLQKLRGERDEETDVSEPSEIEPNPPASDARPHEVEATDAQPSASSRIETVTPQPLAHENSKFEPNSPLPGSGPNRTHNQTG